MEGGLMEVIAIIAGSSMVAFNKQVAESILRARSEMSGRTYDNVTAARVIVVMIGCMFNFVGISVFL